MTFANSELNYVDLDGAWGQFRLFVGGKDVTNFRGKRAQIGSYQLTEPHSFGPADFSLPSLTQFEVDQWGTGALKWMGNGKPVVLKQVDDAGVVVRVVWRGFITIPEVTSTAVVIHCDGEASGRLSMRTRLPALFLRPSHVGRKIFDAFNHCRIQLSPFLGGDIGVITDGRGMSGSYLDYVNALLAATIDTDGSQYTIAYRDGARDYRLRLKDTTTTDFTIFTGSHGVELDLSSDLSEQPNIIYGQGVSPDGLIWVNGKYPGLMQGTPPRYPMAGAVPFGAGTTDADTTSGAGVTVMIRRLIGMGYVGRKSQRDGYNYDADVVEAIKDLQDDAGLTQSGTMNPATWDALYDLDVTGLGVKQAFVAPLAQASNVRQWDRTGSGELRRRNPDYDPKAIQVDLAVDHGTSVEKSRARRWSRGVLHRSQNGKQWAGTITLTADVFAGSYFHTDGDPTLMSRLDIKAGMNVLVRHFDGTTLFHVSIVNVNADLSVTLGVDTQARDAATLGEVIARNIESRSHPARQWLQARRTDANARFVEFSEVGGQVFDDISCPGGRWTVFPVVAGQAGSVARVRLQTKDSRAAFAVAITALKTSSAFWDRRVPNPLSGGGVSSVSVSDGGHGYTSPPSVSISGGDGGGAHAVATLTSVGTIDTIRVTNHGSGFTTEPSVSISGGGGTGAQAHASITTPKDWIGSGLADLIDRDRALLGAWGTGEQPCGYHPRSHTKDDGTASDAPVTGLFLDDGGFDYHTFGDPVVYVAIYPDRDTTIPAQRVLWETLEVNT